ncbi:MAG TPA: hypothetical protein VJ476_10460 [Rhizomicrobium sp.]|nr:hypothetical protein [Rhizomicrobium sp.]
MKLGAGRIVWLMVCVVAAGFATPFLAGLLYVTVFHLNSAIINFPGLMVVVASALSLMFCAFFGVFRRINGWRASVGIAAVSAAVGTVVAFSFDYALPFF